MNIGASLSSAIAELGSQTASPVAPDSAAAASVSSASSLMMKVADEAVVEDTGLGNATGLVNAWA
ncbi:hypothetical protein [Acidocella sp.]|jgi:hypothetical protein|uniref:hypothetical protein n=1 Tax=Acidocella sp. TaxID=50710 RepID=UPI002F4077F0